LQPGAPAFAALRVQVNMETPTMVTHQTRTIDPSLVDAFASMIRGQVLSPGDPEYDDGRAVRNGMIDRRPALIVRASGTRDAVTFAREQRLTLSVRGGAYLNFPGFGEEKDAPLRATYGPNYGRLVALKTQYDPDNVFHMNQNIRPAGR
jgi:hypothetical protein